METKLDLNPRLVKFAGVVIKMAKRFPKTTAATHIATQIERSASAPALHYGEAQAAESPKDFIHKMKGALKELRETYNALGIAKEMSWLPDEDLAWALDENNQLISIFYTSIQTASGNKKKGDRKKPKKDNTEEEADNNSPNPDPLNT